MRKVLFIVTLLFVISGLIALGIYYWAGREAGNSLSVAGVATDAHEVMPVNFYLPGNFYSSIERAETVGFVWPREKVRAGIIPHDLTQGLMIAHMMDGLTRQNVKKVILLGPNHHEAGASEFITTAADWETEFGLVATDDQLVGKILEYPGFSLDAEVIADEHSVSAIAPYLGYYLPEAEIVPVIFKANIRASALLTAAEWLDEIVDENTVVLAAVDFSHYLSADQAALKDLQTQQWLTALDYASLENLGSNFNDYLDSPAVIGLLLRWLEQQGFKTSQIISQANSSDSMGDTNNSTTSYFEVIYY